MYRQQGAITQKTIITTSILIVCVAIFCLGWIIFRSGCSKQTCVAQVDGKQITKSTFDKELFYKQKLYQGLKQNIASYPALPDDTKQDLIDATIVTQYAQQNGITVSDQDLTQRYQTIVGNFIAPGGGAKIYSAGAEQKYLAMLHSTYGLTKGDYLDRLKVSMLKDLIQQKTSVPYSEWIAKQRQTAHVNLY